MPVTVTIRDRDVQRSIRNINKHLKNPAPFYRQASKHMRNYVRTTITLQGRKFPYKKLSWWTQQRTGRRKALITLRPRIKSAHSMFRGVVYFDPVSTAWHIDQHHTGFISPAVTNKRMVVPKDGGGILAIITKRKESRIPRREIWPSAAELAREVNPIAEKWVARGTKKEWR